MIPRAVHHLVTVPVHALLLALIGLPALYVFWLSLHKYGLGIAPSYVGFANYAAVIADPYFWRAFRNTLLIVFGLVLGELAAGLAVALLFAGGVAFRRVMIAIVLAPYAVSEVVAVIIWKYMLEPDLGIVTQALRFAGLPELSWTTDPAAALLVIVLIGIWLHLPFTFIVLYAARLGIPRELYEAATIDGANPWAIFRGVTLPLLVPAISIALLFRFVFAFRIFSEVWLLTGGGPARTTEVLATYLYRQAFRYHEFGLASATGWLMLLSTLLIALGYIAQIYRRMLRADA
jgi:multiple sugar transport system permease protein